MREGRLEAELREAHADARGLYDRLAVLARQKDRAPSPEIDREIETISLRLQEIEGWEADRLVEAFEARLSTPINAGRVLIDKIEAFQKKHEDPTP